MIKKVAVIGAGTMGSGIASHLSNAGVEVILMDLVSSDGNDRNAIARKAIDGMLSSSPPALMHADNAALITPANLEDDLHLLAQVDWIAEAIVERIDIKRALYRQIDQHRRVASFVSSNTSTLPLAMLVEGQSDAFKADFCITHFFNPVRYMRLLEIVAGVDTRAEVISTLSAFCDHELGKGVVNCRDTPGFLGNRVGVFALQAGLVEAQAQGISIEQADAIMGRPMGIPKTGLFGLYDLIGIDLMLDVVKSLQLPLPDNDAFHDVAAGIAIVNTLVTRGDTGNKGGAGFYRTRSIDGKRVREALDLASGEYHPATREQPEAARIGEQLGLRALVTHPSAEGRFAWRVLARTLSYAASLIPQVSNTPSQIDEAMKLGYSWTRGPFEMIDELGPAWFKEQLIAHEFAVPEVLQAIGDGQFYQTANAETDSPSIEQFGVRTDSNKDGALQTAYVALERAPGIVRLTDLKRTRTRLLGNDAASLWHIGDDVACVEFHTKANALTPQSMQVLAESIEYATTQCRALLIHNDAAHFSVGFNLDFVLECIRAQHWRALDESLLAFQQTCSACSTSPIPVLAAPSGLGMGGGYEVLVHCNALQVHSNTTLGPVEPTVGLIPSGGGCKQMLHRWSEHATNDASLLEAGIAVFKLIGKSHTASSPQLARPLHLLREHDRVSMNRERLLSDAKAYALQLAQDFHAPTAPTMTALGPQGKAAMQAVLKDLVDAGIAQPHDVIVSQKLAHVLCGGDRTQGTSISESEMFALEREAFIELAQTPQTLARIEHMLSSGQALRN